ncbi:MAG: Fe2+-dependent dioxygenase [Gammaproteobacteria bacterium]|nr:Fe2+-dependent dioxygenase [Gammaproteobacteria bacterium]
MMMHVPEVLDRATLSRARGIVDKAQWVDGKATAGTQSELVKNNRQLAEESEAAKQARAIVLEALGKSALFFTAALPKKIFPPLFNRYEGANNAFGNHIDNAVRTLRGTNLHVRTDISATLFLSDPEDYDGGELVVEDTYGTHSVKLPAGDLILYPSSSVHRVQPVTRGARIASFFWIESMVRENERRRLLFDLDLSVLALRQTQGDTVPVVRLTGCYHNLMRMWADL